LVKGWVDWNGLLKEKPGYFGSRGLPTKGIISFPGKWFGVNLGILGVG